VEEAMMIRDKAEIFRFWLRIAKSGGQALVWIVCALSWNAGDAIAAPQAPPGLAFPSWQAWAEQPVIRAGLCEEDGEPCPAYEHSPYAARRAHARRWEPAPEPYIEEPTVVDPKPDCVEERYAAHTYIASGPTLLPRSEKVYDEPCGIKCWYDRLRAGYCGRGCDYYRFRMTEFPEGRLGGDRVRVACR
jgi:hypothetical protein